MKLYSIPSRDVNDAKFCMTPEFTPTIDPEIYAAWPDYCAISVVADGLVNLVRHPAVDHYLEEAVRRPQPAPWTEGHLEAWRSAYRLFGAKPQRTPCSVEALLTRLHKEGQLPRVSAIVDLYNAISVRYAIPVGGENRLAYVGRPRLVRSSGTDTFETTRDGATLVEAVPPGEVVWKDDRGVTCRRWNWRQGVRTRIDLDTRDTWFELERLAPMPVEAALDGARALVEALRQLSPDSRFAISLCDRAGTTVIT